MGVLSSRRFPLPLVFVSVTLPTFFSRNSWLEQTQPLSLETIFKRHSHKNISPSLSILFVAYESAKVRIAPSSFVSISGRISLQSGIKFSFATSTPTIPGIGTHG